MLYMSISGFFTNFGGTVEIPPLRGGTGGGISLSQRRILTQPQPDTFLFFPVAHPHFRTHYNQYFGENIHLFDGYGFLAELTQHISPKEVQHTRRCGAYSSLTRGKWADHPEIIKYSPSGWKANQHPLSQGHATDKESVKS